MVVRTIWRKHRNGVCALAAKHGLLVALILILCEEGETGRNTRAIRRRARLLLRLVTWRCCSGSDCLVNLRASVPGVQGRALLLLREVNWRC